MDTLNQSPKAQGGSGPLVGVAIIILLLAAGGLYFFQTEKARDAGQAAQEMRLSDPGTDPQTENLRIVGSSDTAAAIEADLETTDLGNFETELSAIESQ